jgi:nitrogen regulatory protein P-II 2
MLRQVMILVRPFKAQSVLETLAALDIDSCIVHEAKGYSRQKGYLERYVGSEYSSAFLPKVEFSLWVESERLRELVQRVEEASRTGRIGDGKVFVLPVCDVESLEF